VEDVVVWLRGPLRTGTDNPATVHRTRGGSAANVAAFAAPLVPTRFIGRIGADELGDVLVERLRTCGVDVRAQRGGRTGSIVVLVHQDGERTMLPDRGASVGLAPVPACWLDDVRLLHVPGYVFATEPAASRAYDLIKVAARQHCAVSLDASSTAFLAEYGPARYLDLVADIAPAVLFANSAEADVLGLADRRPMAGTTFVIKDGAAPTTVRRAAGAEIRVPVPAYRHARDTTGAGDAFAAGYLASAINGGDERAAVRAGHRHAARVLDAPGANFATEPVEAT
jgi:sugar/nucleoside kinase (ribokinase family)